MTMLYRLDASAAAIAVRFGVSQGADPWSGGTIGPGRFAPVITAGREAVAGPRPDHLPLRMVPRLWGVPPPPAADDPTRAVLSVRNTDSPFWIGNLRNSEFRCLVPASALMVWGKGRDPEGRRERCWFGCADQSLFALAGVWKDSEIPGFALLASETNALLRAAGRDSMPAILPGDPAAWRTWLYAGWDKARALLAPYPSSLMYRLRPP